MNERFVERLRGEIEEIRSSGLYKTERIITSPQGAEITVNGKQVLNFCANNYLGLSSHPKTIEAADKYLETHGYGMSSVRFICGTQDIHKELEQKLARFLGTEDTILYVAASMPMAVCSSPCSENRTPSFPIRSTTLPLSTAYVSARHNAIAMRTIIWKTSRQS
jgi:7-keto-8-aminopelargonate synthetase-like enzyme